MSSKNKFRKKQVATENSETNAPKSNPVSRQKKAADETGFTLIRFSKPVKVYLLILLSLYFILSLAKVHTSNVGNWDISFGQASSPSVIAGHPHAIRMDEWMITTPAIIGQYADGLPVKNEANGGGNAPVVFGLPIKDISSVLRPYAWPYFIFDIERAFAFSWNFNIFFFLISMFLVFLLLTKNNFWLSVAGSFFIFLLPGVQWWTYSISSQMNFLNGMFISFIYLLYASRRSTIIISSIILILSIFSFLSALYPPFQVPLVYLYLAMVSGFIIREKKIAMMKEGLTQKLLISGAALAFLGFILFHYYNVASDTFRIMMNTVYPGRRFDTGGDLIQGKFFSDFLSMFMSDTHIPQLWQNISEVSGGIMFFPVIFYGLGYYFIKHKKTDPLLIALAVFIIIAALYVLVGFPAFISRLSLFSMSPAYRVLPVLGAANGILLIAYMGSIKLSSVKENFSRMEAGVLAAAIVIFLLAVVTAMNKATANFFTSRETGIAIALISLSYLLIRYMNFRFVKPMLCFLLIAIVIRNAGANPLTKGLTPVLENPLVQVSKTIHEKDPDAGWALFGNVRLTNLLKANGINIFNGVKYVPNMEVMRQLDPQKLKDSVYNRYAWVSMSSYIDGNDGINIAQNFNDSYTIHIDPCSPRLQQLKVKYFVFEQPPQPNDIRCMTKIADVMNFSIYKRNNP